MWLRGSWAIRAKWVAALAVLFVLWVIAAPFLADILVLERRLDRADAVVILGGAADYQQRARGAADAFRAGAASRILLTDDGQRGGWDDAERGNPFFVERARRVLQAAGVPTEVIEVLPRRVSGTDNEAELIVRSAVERRMGSIVVVTSAYHSRRALWTLDRANDRQHAGLTIGMTVSPSGDGYPHRLTWWLTPRGWRSVGAEYVKFAWYWLFC